MAASEKFAFLLLIFPNILISRQLVFKKIYDTKIDEGRFWA